MSLKLTPKQRLALIVFQSYECEACRLNGIRIKRDPNDLEIHRIKAGFDGGDYTDHRTLMVLCSVHHDILSSAQRKALGVQS